MKRRGRKDVGVGRRSRTRCSRPLAGTWGVREVSATRNSDCSAEADGSLMLPEVLRPAPGEGIRTGLMIPHVGKVLVGTPVGKDVEEAQELSVNPPRGGHDARQKGVGGARAVGISVTIPLHLGARSGLEDLVDVAVAQLPVAGDVLAGIATELVGAGNVDDQMPGTANAGILDE